MTRADETKPVRRVVQTDDGEMVAEVRARTLTLRPVRTRKGGPAEVCLSFSSLYTRALLARVTPLEQRKRRKAR